MKSLNFSKRNLQFADALTKSEMKKIMGGHTDPVPECNCNSADECTASNEMCINGCNGKEGDKYQGVCGCS
jgi:hypothetical protein